MRNRTIIYMKNAEIAFLPPFDPGVFLLMAIYRLALEKWHAICNTCYIYYTTNNVPYDDLYLSGNQSDDIYARDSNLRVAPVKWHAICNTCYIYYTSNRVPCDDLYLSGNQSDDIYVRVAYLRVASVKWHATNIHTHICIIIQQIACHLWYIFVR